MNDFHTAADHDCWGLQAVVDTFYNKAELPNSNASFECFGLEDYQDQQNEIILNGLELRKPFQGDMPLCSSQNVHKEEEVQKPTSVACSNSRQGSRSRRKNKRVTSVVQQATSDRLLSDRWNWRKYGEKAIKGSCYPRSYYRCSTLGGCKARKQVEQSSTSPGTFLITYIDEHSHPYPTKRHPQAGQSARRFDVSSKISKTYQASNMLMNSSFEDQTNLGQRDNETDVQRVEGRRGNMTVDYDPSMGWEEDDFFAGLDYLEKLAYGVNV